MRHRRHSSAQTLPWCYGFNRPAAESATQLLCHTVHYFITAPRYALARSLLSPGVRPFVRLSVRLYVTLVYYIHTAEDIVKLLCLPGSPIILVFLTPGADTQFQGEPLQRGRKIQGGGKILRYSTEIAVYLGNDTR